MSRAAILAAFFTVTASAPALAQTAPYRWSGEFITGLVLQGSQASASFAADFSTFGGVLVERSGGSLDIVPSAAFGVRTGVRLGSRVQLLGSWMHSEGRYRIEFPALADDPGDFNLEGLILAGYDFQLQGSDSRAESAHSTAVSDFYVASLRYEVPTMQGWLFPYMTAGGGLYTQRSTGDVIEMTFQGPVPDVFQLAALEGVNPLVAQGLAAFRISENDPLVMFGAGFRASLGKKWGVAFEIEDLIRMNVDMTAMNASATPPPNPETGQFWSTAFQGAEGTIHNLSIMLSLNYALWPYGEPR